MAKGLTLSNEHKIANYCADMTLFCRLINDTLRTMTDNLYFDCCSHSDIVTPLANGDLQAFKEAVISRCIKADEIKSATDKIMRDVLIKQVGSQAQQYYNAFRLQLEKNRIQLRMQDHERIEFLKVGANGAFYEPDEIRRKFTSVFDSKVQKAFIQRTEKIYADMVAYNEECKRMGANGIHNDGYCLIRVDAWGITIDWDNLKLFNFD